MLDDLRNSAGSPFLDEEPIEEVNAKPKINSSNFLGMTAPQRFVVSIFLFFMVMILGVFLLILFQKVYFPF
ncbi:hypothetical protein SDC9_89411 [bioreactor metagenome]|uniref:Uncharacterized protein n=1 Tax=bioreactor metagenome TaxID=1076179 RepID=A0A644ZS80_9ZZZZ